MSPCGPWTAPSQSSRSASLSSRTSRDELSADVSHSQFGVQVFTLISNLCQMLRTTPFHRENYSRLIVSVVTQFYQRCNIAFGGASTLHMAPTSSACSRSVPKCADFVARSAPRPGLDDQSSISAVWAQRAELVASLDALLKLDLVNSVRFTFFSLRVAPSG